MVGSLVMENYQVSFKKREQSEFNVQSGNTAWLSMLVRSMASLWIISRSEIPWGPSEQLWYGVSGSLTAIERSQPPHMIDIHHWAPCRQSNDYQRESLSYSGDMVRILQSENHSVPTDCLIPGRNPDGVRQYGTASNGFCPFCFLSFFLGGGVDVLIITLNK